MPIMVKWDDEAQSVVLMRFQGKWSWDEMYKAAQESVALRKAKTHRCALILDLLQGANVPTGALTHLRNALSISSEDREITVVLTDKPFLKTLYTMFTKLYKKLGDTLFLADTMEDARRVISEWRAAKKQTEPLTE
jgi:hypothetical protein